MFSQITDVLWNTFTQLSSTIIKIIIAWIPVIRQMTGLRTQMFSLATGIPAALITITPFVFKIARRILS